MPHKTFIDIAVELPVDGLFTYRVPEGLSGQAAVGKRVLAPFGKRIVTGFCVAFTENSTIKEIKDILDVLDEKPLFDEKRLKFFQWMASYYFAPLGAVLGLIHPAGINIKSRRRFYAAEQKNGSQGFIQRHFPGQNLKMPLTSMMESGAGRSQKENLPPIAIKIFDAITEGNGISLAALAKMFRGKSIYSAIYGLKQAGLIREEVTIKGRTVEKTESFLSLLKSETSLPPLQAKIVSYLSANKEASLKTLRKEFGNIDTAVKRLEQKGIVSLIHKKIHRDPLEDTIPETVSHKPTDEQERAIHAISRSLMGNAFSPFLLYGVTGSGKTLVYLKALEKAVSLGKQAIFLVPEISLMPWPMKYLAALFPGRVAVLHSGLSDGERYDEWRRIKDGKADVVVGARSALFAPLENAGLIIVDEEHEPSYKQEDGVRYNARDVSLMMGKMFNLTVVLGSATPSIETFYNAKNGKITPLHLTKRVEERPMPKIELVDMRKQGQEASLPVRGRTQTGGKGQEENRKEIISEKLQDLMLRNHELGYQTILFLNRRGFSNFLICNDCGHSFQCLNCNVSLTLHKRGGLLKCHYCDMTMPIPDACPKCRGSQVRPIGVGTEQLEEEARKMLHRSKVARMDRDTTAKKRAHQQILDAVDKGNVDVLVGTQMVAKGHHFPNVTLVGIVSADTSLNIPDFRSSERTFQLITQAAGRAGRGTVSGEVVVQTFAPEHFCIQRAVEQNYEAFFQDELNARKDLLYPPFSRLAVIRFEGNKEDEVETAANKAKRLAASLLESNLKKEIIALGPAPAFLSKLKGKYRWQLLVKGSDVRSLHECIGGILKGFEGKRSGGVKLSVDVDPATTL
ncbi:MAG: primosomal protein N' [Deltaproteobacteria bacterium]|nr:primosomal protein N' [Deltaproteobacteria bacterium]